MTNSHYFHDGERALQRRVGAETKNARLTERLMHSVLPEQHRTFYSSLRLICVGTFDHHGHVWTTLISGAPGFVHSPSPNRLVIENLPIESDPLYSALQAMQPVGILGLEFETRRRNRVNGYLVARHDHRLEIEVEQAFGNCPKYIQTRDYVSTEIPLKTSVEFLGTQLDYDGIRQIERADTFFIASHSSRLDRTMATGCDVSHRGGMPGFVSVAAPDRLIVPDYPGNNLFNTLGNLIQAPHCGLYFPDFHTGTALTMTGRASVVFDGPQLQAFPGAQRLMDIQFHDIRRIAGAIAPRYRLREYSPHNPTLISPEISEK